MDNYFNKMMFNQQFVNQAYYRQCVQGRQSQEKPDQDKKVRDAVKAIHDLCEAVKGMDEPHQQQAFIACLAEMARELHW